MRRDQRIERAVAAAVIVIGWVGLLTIFGLVGAVIILAGGSAR